MNNKMPELTNIIKRNGNTYSIKKLIRNGIEYAVEGGDTPAEQELLLTVENIFTPKKITLTDSITNSGGTIKIVEDLTDMISSDGTSYYHFFFCSEPVSSTVSAEYIRCIYKTETTETVVSDRIVGYAEDGIEIERTGLFRVKQSGDSGYVFSYLVYQNHYDSESVLDYVIWRALNSDGNSVILTTTPTNEITDEILQLWTDSCGITEAENYETIGYTSLLAKAGTASGKYTIVISTHKPLTPDEYGEDYIEAQLINGKIPLTGECYYSIDGGSFLYSESNGTPIISGDHIVRVVPVDRNRTYATSFVYNGSNTPTGIIRLIHDAPFKRYCDNNVIGNNFKQNQFKGCTNLISVPSKSVELPNTVTSIGNNYMYGMFEGCTSLESIPFNKEELPSSVISVGDNYMYNMFKGCTSLSSVLSYKIGDGLQSVGNYFKAYQFQNCTNLLNAPEEDMPYSLSTIGTYFRAYQFDGCSKLTSAGDEIMTNSLTNIGVYARYYQFRNCKALIQSANETTKTGGINSELLTIGENYKREQYSGCTNLSTTGTESMPNIPISIGNNYKRLQFSGCTGLLTLSNEVISNSIVSIGDYYRAEQYPSGANINLGAKEIATGTNNPSGTTIGSYYKYRQYYNNTRINTAGEEILPGNTISIGNYFRTEMYNSCSNLMNTGFEFMPDSVTSIGNYFRSSQYKSTHVTTAAPEVLSRNILTIGTHFRASQYESCTSLLSASKESIFDSVTTIGNYFRYSQYNGCTLLQEISGWKDLSIGGSYYRYNQFNGCNNMKIVYVIGGVGYASYNTSTLSNTYVDTVFVEVGRLNEFVDAKVNPWSNITDGKFIELRQGQIIYSYTGRDQLMEVEESGLYNFTIKGAGSNSASGGLTTAKLNLVSGDKLTIVVGQNGGSSKVGTYGFGGAGTTNYNAGGGLSGVFTGEGTVTSSDSSRAILIAGGAGAGPSGKGGAGGGETGADGVKTSFGDLGSGGTQEGHGTSGNVADTQFSGGIGSNTYGNGGGGGRRGGNGGTGDTSGNDDSGAGGGSGFISSNAIDGSMIQGGANNINGNGIVIIYKE